MVYYTLEANDYFIGVVRLLLFHTFIKHENDNK